MTSACFIDCMVWSWISLYPEQLDALAKDLAERRKAVLFTPSLALEMHALHESETALRSALTAALRRLTGSTMTRYYHELLAYEVAEALSEQASQEYKDALAGLDHGLITSEDREPYLPGEPNPRLIAEIAADKRTKYERMKLVKFFDAKDVAAMAAFEEKVAFFEKLVTRPEAQKIASQCRRIAKRKPNPFVHVFNRAACNNVELQFAALEVLVMNRTWLDLDSLLRGDVENPVPAGAMMARRREELTRELRMRAYVGRDLDFMFRTWTYWYVFYYLTANGFSKEDGSFIYDAEHAVYAHEVDLFVTGDSRLYGALTSPLLQRHFAKYNRALTVRQVSRSPDVVRELRAAIGASVQ